MKSVFKSFLFFILAVVLINKVSSFLDKVDFSAPLCIDEVSVDSLQLDHNYTRAWSDAYEKYCMDYYASNALYLESKADRERITFPKDYYTFAQYWGDLYRQLIENNEQRLDYIADSLVVQAAIEGITGRRFAEMIVTFVQDIPYSYVQTEPCEESETNGKPCLDGIEYGIISPIEFLHTLYGDCDTRSVLLYCLLNRFGFETLVVVSKEYKHAMIAVNIPSAGDFLIHESKKYYFWETTHTGWPIGMLPPDVNEVDYWEIAI
ncbi:MAG: hypothetical protein JXQ90_04300 [Cyclobacteriaceae bacterium]